MKNNSFMAAGTVAFTEKARNSLRKAGATDEIIRELIQTIKEQPYKGYTIDTRDGITCLNIPISFIRDHARNSVLILLTEEAREADKHVKRN